MAGAGAGADVQLPALLAGTGACSNPSALCPPLPPFLRAGEREVFALSMACGNLFCNQKVSVPLFTEDPGRGVFLLFPKSSLSVNCAPWTLLKWNQEFPAGCCPGVSVPCAHGSLSNQPQFTPPAGGSPE